MTTRKSMLSVPALCVALPCAVAAVFFAWGLFVVWVATLRGLI